MAFQGSLKELPLPDIIQLVSVGGKSGAFQLRNGAEVGQIFLRKGQIVHAKVGSVEGEEAVFELAIWRDGDFAFTPGTEPERVTIERSNTTLLMEAVRRVDEWGVLSKKIPSTRLVPVFPPRGANTSVSLSAQEWALICKVDERRTIEELATGLGLSVFDACKVLYGLLASGLIDLREDLHRFGADRFLGLDADELGRLVAAIAQGAQALLGGAANAELDKATRLAHATIEAGHGADGLVDLIRAGEKTIALAHGPSQAKAFLDRVGELLGTG